jgi:hypothetical protein
VHSALEAYYKGGRDLKKCLRAFRTAWGKEDRALRATYGGLYSMGIEDEWLMHKERGEEMLKCYDLFDKANPFFDEIISYSIEERAFVEVLGPDDEGIGALLSGRIDMVVRRKDGIWIVDHKALASVPVDTALDIDDQLTGYCYIYWRLTGEMPRGALYNVLVKDPPKPPRMLKDGSLSKDKSQRTTFELYLQAINDLGLPVEEYQEVLDFLAASGWRRYFVRQEVRRNMEQLASFERHLFREVRDQMEAIEDPEEAYPNPSQYVCPGCSMMPICKAMEEDGDVDWVINHGFKVLEPRTKIPKGVLNGKVS